MLSKVGIKINPYVTNIATIPLSCHCVIADNKSYVRMMNETSSNYADSFSLDKKYKHVFFPNF